MESLQKFRKLFLELPYDAGFHSAANGKVTTLNQVRYY